VPDECEARLDNKPGLCPNSLNRESSGVLTVGLVGATAFDVSQVDVLTVRLSRGDGTGGIVATYEGPPGPFSVLADTSTSFLGATCDCHLLESDGIVDLSMNFKTDDLVPILELDTLATGTLVELVVSGNLFDGTPFSVTDCVQVVPPGTPPGLVAFLQPDAPTAWIDVGPLDDQFDAGGFGNFDRTFPQSTPVALAGADTGGGKRFVGWRLDGVFVSAELSFGFAVEGLAQTVEVVYRRPGDITGDDIVNLVDFAQFANCFGLPAPSPVCVAEFHSACDLDRSGIIDLVDFATFALNFDG